MQTQYRLTVEAVDGGEMPRRYVEKYSCIQAVVHLKCMRNCIKHRHKYIPGIVRGFDLWLLEAKDINVHTMSLTHFVFCFNVQFTGGCVNRGGRRKRQLTTVHQ